MTKRIQFILLCICTFWGVNAQAMSVLSSVKPINLIVQELTAGVATSSYLVPSGASPHDYALRPSDMKKIKNADTIVWYGNDLEPFLSKVLENKKNIITVSQFPSVEFYHFDKHDEDEHAHEGHHHHNTDPHFWLGPKETLGVAKEITKQLIKIDPLNKDQYQSNLAQFEKKVNTGSENDFNSISPSEE